MNSITLLAGLVGLGGLLVLRDTLDVTYRQLDLTERQLNLTNSQVDLTSQQLDVTAAQLKMMKLAERPWLSHVILLDKIERASNGSLRFFVRHELKNHGKSVALYVRFDGRVRIGGGRLSPFSERDIICNQQIERRGGAGVLVFPDQALSEVRQETITVNEITSELAYLRNANGGADLRRISVVLLACATYQTSFQFLPSLTEAEDHQTGHVFMVGVPEPDGNVTSVDVDAPQAGISLVEFPHGAFAR